MNSPPHVTFSGPSTDLKLQVALVHAKGFEIERYTISPTSEHFVVRKFGSTKHICEATSSSLPGSTTLQVRDMRLEFKDGSELLTGWTTPLSKLRWKQETMPGGWNTKLVDENGNLVAIAYTKDNPRMKLYVKEDEFFRDCMLAGWVAYLFQTQKERETKNLGSGKTMPPLHPNNKLEISSPGDPLPTSSE